MDPRLRFAARLYFFFVLGVFLVAAPWSPVWDHLMASMPPSGLASVIGSGWVRGAVSGLGLVDLMFAAREAALLVSGRREA